MTGEITILPPGSNAVGPVETPSDISGAVDDHELIHLWLADCRSKHTLRAYERVAYKLLATLPHGLRGATVTDIARFEASLAGQKPNSKHTIMNIVRSLYSFCQRTGYVNRSVAHVRKNRRPPHNSRGRRLENEEVWALIDHAASDRDKLMLRFLYGTAMRISEMCGLIWADVFVSDKGASVQILGKGGKYRTVSVPAWIGLSRPDCARSDDAIFTAAESDDAHPWLPMSETNVRRIIREAALMAGIAKKVSPHWFRHSAITTAEENGESLQGIRDWVGHSSIATTNGYLHSKTNSAPGDTLGRKPKT